MKACGGCTALNRPYKKQLATKQAAMEELFAALCEHEGISVDPIRGMGVTLGDPGKYPAPRGFRHKAATPFAPGKEGAVRCGFFERGTHKIVAVPECPVEAPGARQILNGIAREAERLHIPAFNEDKHLGLLRYAVVRCGWRTDQVMVTLVTAQRDLPHAQEFFEAVAALNPHIVTVRPKHQRRPGNAILGENPHCIWRRVHARPAARLRIRHLPHRVLSDQPATDRAALSARYRRHGFAPGRCAHGCLLWQRYHRSLRS